MEYINNTLVKCWHNADRYIKFINSRIELNKSRTYKPGVYESHHILPKSMGGTDRKINRINLTYREHYIAHLMLYMIYRNNKMAYAILRMNNAKSINSRLYEKYRLLFIQNISGKNNPMYGKHHSLESRQKISVGISGKNNPMYGKKGELNPLYGKSRPLEFIQSISGKNNPMYGKNHTDESILNIAKNRSQHIYIICGKKYDSIKEAMYYTKQSYKTIMYRILSDDLKYRNYIRVDKNTDESTINNYIELTNIKLDISRTQSNDTKNKISNSNTKFYYVIDGTIYNSTNDIVKEFGLTLSQIRYRSNSDKFPNFKKMKK